MWLKLSLAGVIALVFLFILAKIVGWLFLPKSKKISKNEIYKRIKFNESHNRPYRINIHFIRAIPVFLTLLGLIFFFIPLFPLLKHYELTGQPILKQRLAVFMMIIVGFCFTGLLYASIKKNLSWKKAGGGK